MILRLREQGTLVRFMKVSWELAGTSFNELDSYKYRYDGSGSYFHGKDGFNDVPFDDRPDVAARVEKENAVDAIRRVVKNNPGKC